MLVKCPKCSKEFVVKRGFRTTENRGRVQRYFCKSCKHRFVVDDGFYHMRNSPEKITQALHLYYSGASLRKSQEHLGVFFPHNASHTTLLRWIRRYASLVGCFVDTLPLKVGQELMSDEMGYTEKGKQCWFVDVLDTKTRYIVSSGLVRGRTNEVLIQILRKAKERTGDQVKKVTTDGLNGYPQILHKSFGLRNDARSKIIHDVVIASERGFNHKIERLHNSIRERTKIFRGFGNLESAKLLMKGYEIYYNYCRKHQATRKYPYELATDLTLGKNKWLDLIRLASS